MGDAKSARAHEGYKRGGSRTSEEDKHTKKVKEGGMGEREGLFLFVVLGRVYSSYDAGPSDVDVLSLSMMILTRSYTLQSQRERDLSRQSSLLRQKGRNKEDRRCDGHKDDGLARSNPQDPGKDALVERFEAFLPEHRARDVHEPTEGRLAFQPGSFLDTTAFEARNDAVFVKQVFGLEVKEGRGEEKVIGRTS